MGPANDNDHTLADYCLPGEVAVSAAALEYAREFAEALNPEETEGRDLVAFCWATNIRVRLPVNRWTEQAPAPALFSHDRNTTPEAAFHDLGGFRFVVRIPKEVLAASERRLIDYEPTSATKLTLR